jgi:hypothetical protein
VKVDWTLVIPCSADWQEPWESCGEKGVGSVRLQILEGYVFYPSTSSEASSTGWSDGLSVDTVGLSDAQFEFIQRRAKTKPSALDDPTPWSRWSVGLSDSRVKANRGDLDAGSSALDDPTYRRCIASEQLCQRISTAMWRERGTGWTDALENLASVDQSLLFQWPLANG